MSVVICTDLSGKELLRQVGVDRVVASGGLGVILNTAVRNVRDLGLIPTLGIIFSHFHHPHGISCHD